MSRCVELGKQWWMSCKHCLVLPEGLYLQGDGRGGEGKEREHKVDKQGSDLRSPCHLA